MRFLNTNTLMALLLAFVAALVRLGGDTGLLVALVMAASFLLADALAAMKLADLRNLNRDLNSMNARGGNANGNGNGNKNGNGNNDK